MNVQTVRQLEKVKASILVLDIETCASYPDGEKIDIRTNFEDYILLTI